MLKESLSQLLTAAVVAAQADGSLPAFEVPAIEMQRPKQADHGDYSSNVAMVAAAAIRKAGGAQSNPRQIAQAVVDHLPVEGPVGCNNRWR
jgi:arginyl-tRNA synthetase